MKYIVFRGSLLLSVLLWQSLSSAEGFEVEYDTSLSSHSQVPQQVEWLHHWTNSTRFEEYRGKLYSGRMPLKKPHIEKKGENYVGDLFFLVHPELRNMNVIYTWSDATGGMGYDLREFYAKLDPSSNKRPKLISGLVNPSAKVLKVKTIRKGGRFEPVSFRIPQLKKEQVEGFDLILHEVYFEGKDGQRIKNIQEWIIISDNAILEVHHTLRHAKEVARRELKRVNENMFQTVEGVNPEAFREVELMQDKAIEVWEYLLSLNGQSCKGLEYNL